MQNIDYLIVAENATLGQKIYTDQRKVMLEDLGYSVKIVSFSGPKMRITLDMLRIAYNYKKNLEKNLETLKPQIIEFYCPATLILQDKQLLKNYKTIASFDLPFGVNTLNFGSSILHRLERQKFLEADLIFSLTKYGMNFLRSKYQINRKMVYLPYVLDPKEQEGVKVYNGDFALSYCPEERLERKGFDILMGSWNIINSGKKLIVMGINRERANKYLLKKGIVLPENVEFIHFLPREEFLSLISSCSFFISSSRFEEFGQIIIEALSFGKPVITTPTLGPSELLGEIDKKLICPTFSPIDLARTIEYLEENSSSMYLEKIRDKFMKNNNYHSVKNRLNEEITALLAG